MRGDVQEIFKMTPHDKQVMMFSATLSKEIRPVCKKFMNDVSCTARRHPTIHVAPCRPPCHPRGHARSPRHTPTRPTLRAIRPGLRAHLGPG